MEIDTIVCGDCLDVMREMSDGCVDLVFADPPYNVGLNYGKVASDDKRDDYESWCGDWFQECRRVIKNRGFIFLTVGIGNLKQWFEHDPVWILAWHKPFSLRRVIYGMINNWEPILMFGNRKAGSPNQDVIRALLYQDGKSQHPCPKPVSLLTQLIEQSTEINDLVFDPFMGSGTTAVAAIKLGRYFYGCDINQDYVDIANERIAKARLEAAQMEMAI